MEKYKIIGGDGREYGPATLDELKSWITEGRVGRDTLVWNADTEAWLRASQMPEIQADLRALYDEPAKTSAVRRVGFWPRLAAYMIDQAILATVVMAALPIGVKYFGLEPLPLMDATTIEEMTKQMEQANKSLWPMLIVVKLLYYVTFNGAFCATPGKMVIGARIVQMDGAPIGFGIALFRCFGQLLSDILCYIGNLFVAFRPDRRALHDLLAGTQVIYKR